MVSHGEVSPGDKFIPEFNRIHKTKNQFGIDKMTVFKQFFNFLPCPFL